MTQSRKRKIGENMTKKIVIIEGSPRVNGNSDILAREFAKGAQEAGHEVETIAVRSLKLEPCMSCFACVKTHECFRKDQMTEVLQKLVDADVIVLATPTFFYSVTGQMKVFIDRTFPRFMDIKNKEFYCMITAADDNSLLEPVMTTLKGFVDCCEGSTIKGKVYGGGYGVKGAIENSPAAEEAYQLGLQA